LLHPVFQQRKQPTQHTPSVQPTLDNKTQQIQELEDAGARKLGQVLAGWRAEMARLRVAAAGERGAAEARWKALSCEASAAAAWHQAAVGGARWFWEGGPAGAEGGEGGGGGGE